MHTKQHLCCKKNYFKTVTLHCSHFDQDYEYKYVLEHLDWRQVHIKVLTNNLRVKLNFLYRNKACLPPSCWTHMWDFCKICIVFPFVLVTGCHFCHSDWLASLKRAGLISLSCRGGCQRMRVEEQGLFVGTVVDNSFHPSTLNNFGPVSVCVYLST